MECKECTVCVEPYNRSTRAVVTCPWCEYRACRQCYETFVLQQTEAKCMGCTKGFTREQMVERFTRVFLNGKYKFHREQCLFELEKAMLPATQPILERRMEDARIQQEIAEHKQQILNLQRKIRSLEESLSSYHRESTVERKTFIRKCPNSDCRGFLSTQWKCNLCSFYTCKECNVCMKTGEDDHKCDPCDVETVKLLAKDSKPCPKCGEMIFKIDGCDQMYCTQCHTAFSWRTGRVESGTVHNPHYFEWLRKNNQPVNRDVAAVYCGREIDDHFVRSMVRRSRPALEFSRALVHFRYVILPRFRTHDFADNQELRIAYLKKELSDIQFRTTLQQREKAREKKMEYYRLLSMFLQCATEIMYRYNQEERERGHEIRGGVTTVFPKYFEEILNLLTYVNECLARIAYLFGSQRHYLTDDLKLERFTSLLVPTRPQV